MKTKKILVICLSILFAPYSTALPILGSPYAGAEGGLIFTSKPKRVSLDDSLDWFAPRYFAGYQFLSILGVEAGYDRFQNTTIAGDIVGSNKFQLNGYDLSLKVFTPCLAGFKFYAYVGGACFTQQTVELQDGNDQHYVSIKQTNLLPTAGIGVMYELIPHVGIRLSWQHYCGSDDINPVDFFPLGLYLSI